MRRRRTGWLLLGLLTVMLAAWLFPRSDFVARDACLDSGGAWRDGDCIGARSGQ